MKILEKKEFIVFLQEISKALDKEQIKHDIPYCHIDKKTWNYTTILIPDFISSYDLLKQLNMTEYKEKSGIIYAKINDFDVRFVKTSEKMWSYTFYYYSWDILNVLMNILTKSYSLSYTRFGLFYTFGKKTIPITTNLKDIFDFFYLPFHQIINGFLTIDVLFLFIEAADYFNSNNFTIKELNKLDYYSENNKEYYENFIKHIPDIQSEEKTLEEKIALIDAFFPKSDFVEKLTKIQLKEEHPNIKFKTKKEKIVKKNMTDAIDEKAEEIKKYKKKKKINLSKYFIKKEDPGHDEFSISD